MLDSRPSRLRPAVGKNDRVVVALLQLLDTRGDISAKLGRLDVRPRASEKRPAPQAARADTRAGRQSRQRVFRPAEQRVTRIFTLHNRNEIDPGLQQGREILEAMNRDVDFARAQRAIDFLGEEGAPVNGPEGHIVAHVAFGADMHQLNRGRAGLAADEPGHMPRLPQSERRCACADAERARLRHGSTLTSDPAAIALRLRPR